MRTYLQTDNCMTIEYFMGNIVVCPVLLKWTKSNKVLIKHCQSAGGINSYRQSLAGYVMTENQSVRYGHQVNITISVKIEGNTSPRISLVEPDDFRFRRVNRQIVFNCRLANIKKIILKKTIYGQHNYYYIERST